MKKVRYGWMMDGAGMTERWVTAEREEQGRRKKKAHTYVGTYIRPHACTAQQTTRRVDGDDERRDKLLLQLYSYHT
jgi:hypothetical protein